MDDYELLVLLKADIGVIHARRDAFYLQLIKSAMGFIRKRGIVLTDDDPEDKMLVVMYAAYLKERREKGPTAMPDYLRVALNDRLLHEKMRDSNV